MFAFLFRIVGRRLLIAALPALLGLLGALARRLLDRRGSSTESAETAGPAHGETAPNPGLHALGEPSGRTGP